MEHQKNRYITKERRRELRAKSTDVERILWSKLRNRQFFGLKFFRQYGFGFYILDFYCPKLHLAIELDGGQHASPEAVAYDEDRTTYLKHHGIDVVRFWNNDVTTNLDGVLAEICKHLTVKSPVATPPTPLCQRGENSNPPPL